LEPGYIGIGQFFIGKRALEKTSPFAFMSWFGTSFYNKIKAH
jgi:hypothetical protein